MTDAPSPVVPLDDAALDAIEHALPGCFEVDDDGTHRLVGADYTLDQLLQFWSGIDPNEEGTLVGYVDSPLMGNVPMYEMPGVYLTERDVIAALIAEVRSLRAEVEALRGEPK